MSVTEGVQVLGWGLALVKLGFVCFFFPPQAGGEEEECEESSCL